MLEQKLQAKAAAEERRLKHDADEKKADREHQVKLAEMRAEEDRQRRKEDQEFQLKMIETLKPR